MTETYEPFRVAYTHKHTKLHVHTPTDVWMYIFDKYLPLLANTHNNTHTYTLG